jgi:hypothetical protein
LRYIKEFSRADSGFYCWDAVKAYERNRCEFIIAARKTSPLVERLQTADWKSSPKTDADGQCEFCYQPAEWGKEYRFLALRYLKKPKAKEEKQPEQYQLFDTPEYSYVRGSACRTRKTICDTRTNEIIGVQA